MNKICKGDEVLVIAGKDKSKRGVVRALVGSSKVLVEGVNLVKKHVKPNPMKGDAGGVVSKEMPMDVSNVLLFNPVTQKGDRVGFKLLENGDKVRVFKSNGEIIAKA
jgi:large subunit ribosomal protein L24